MLKRDSKGRFVKKAATKKVTALRDAKGRFIKKTDKVKKATPMRDAKGRFLKKTDGCKKCTCTCMDNKPFTGGGVFTKPFTALPTKLMDKIFPEHREKLDLEKFAFKPKSALKSISDIALDLMRKNPPEKAPDRMTIEEMLNYIDDISKDAAEALIRSKKGIDGDFTHREYSEDIPPESARLIEAAVSDLGDYIANLLSGIEDDLTVDIEVRVMGPDGERIM